jgi:hypothetical protein
MEKRTAIVDPFPVEELSNLYAKEDGSSLGRTAIGNRMKAIGIKSFPVRGQGSKRFIKAADVLRLNMFDVYIRENGTMNGFPDLVPPSQGITSDDRDEASGNRKSASDDSSGIVVNSEFSPSERLTVWQAANQVIQMPVTGLLKQLIKPLEQVLNPPSRRLQDTIQTLRLVAETEALLSTSELASLLAVSSSFFSGKKMLFRKGYKFIRIGREGREFAWRVVKVKLPPLPQGNDNDSPYQ